MGMWNEGVLLMESRALMRQEEVPRKSSRVTVDICGLCRSQWYQQEP